MLYHPCSEQPPELLLLQVLRQPRQELLLPARWPLVLLRAAWGEKRRPGAIDADPQLGWGRWAQGGVQLEHIACWHSDVLRPEQATALAAVLQKHMARPESAGEGGGA